MTMAVSAFCGLFSLVQSGFGQTTKPVPSVPRWELTPEVSYGVVAFKHGDVTRTALGVELARSAVLDLPLRLAANIQWLANVDYEGSSNSRIWDGDGSGFSFDLSARYAPLASYPQGNVYLRGYVLAEEYSGTRSVPVSTDADALGLVLGADYAWTVRPHLDLFGGLEVHVFESGSYKRSLGSTSFPDRDLRRENPLGLRLGGTYDFPSFRLKADLTLISEMRFSLGAGFGF